METKRYTTIDRTALGWPSGEWDGEPDKVQWPDAATGLPCLAVRHPRRGNWCGYVGLPPEHPLYGKDYSDEAVSFDVHGGMTFADQCRPGGDESHGVCHVPGPGEPDHVWWFGFDCAHSCDCSPDDVKLANERGYPFTLHGDEIYRSLSYVHVECTRLAEQVAAAGAA